MWIRNQKRGMLLNLDNNTTQICIDLCNYEIYAVIDYDNYELGVYSSYSKAKKVMDKIEWYLGNKSCNVFSMPQDFEV
jgi:hypothetical protein